MITYAWCILVGMLRFDFSHASPPLCRSSSTLSLRGFDDLNDFQPFPNRNETRPTLLTASCCQSSDDVSECHGGYILTEPEFHTAFEHSSADLSRISHLFKHHQRRKRSADECDAGCVPTEIECCSMNMSIFYPISGISARTGERVHVIQAAPFLLQPVLRAVCSTSQSSILDAGCKQLYVPEMLAIARIDEELRMTTTTEPVLVEYGCECQLNPIPSLEPYDGPGIDDLTSLYLSMWI